MVFLRNSILLYIWLGIVFDHMGAAVLQPSRQGLVCEQLCGAVLPAWGHITRLTVHSLTA